MRIARALVAVGILVSLPACEDLWINSIAPLGGNVPGGRGQLDVIFVNQTQYRAIFTFGTYDPQDQNSVPQFGQFVVDPEQDETPFNRGLDPDTVTDRGGFNVNCGRVFSLGSEGLINRIKESDTEPQNGAPIVEAGLRTGIYLTTAPLDDPDANGVESYDLRLDPVVSLAGVDYECDSALIYTLEPDPENAGEVRVRLESIPATAD